MKTYIALFRGMNVSGKNILKMDDLKKMMIDLGFEKVQSYIQSGNLVFQSSESNSDEIKESIRNEINKQFNLDIQLQLILPEELQVILDENPFIVDETLDLKQHYFAFLDEIPNSENLDEFLQMDLNDELMHYTNKVIYVHYKNGAGQSKLTTNLIERKLKLSTTMRNLNTVQKMVELTKD